MPFKADMVPVTIALVDGRISRLGTERRSKATTQTPRFSRLVLAQGGSGGGQIIRRLLDFNGASPGN